MVVVDFDISKFFLENALDPAAAPVTTKTSQDRPDAAQLRLTREQANALLVAPGLDDLRGLRDTAVIALLLCTGLREGELHALEVHDLRQELARYPTVVNGARVRGKPHDLRRTYARRLYEAGMAPVEIQQNLGHADLQTTLGYIETLDAAQRRPPAVYAFDLSRLRG